MYTRSQLYVFDLGSKNGNNIGPALPIAPNAWEYFISEPNVVVLEEIDESFVVKQIAPSPSSSPVVVIRLRSKRTGRTGSISFTLDDTPSEIVKLSALVVPANVAGPVPISLSATFSDGTLIPNLFAANDCPECYTLITASIQPATGGIFDLKTGILRPGIEASVWTTLNIFAGNSVQVTADFISNRDADVGNVDLGHAMGLAFPTQTGPNGIFKMPVRINAGSARLGPLQVEIGYDRLQFEVVNVEAGTAWGASKLFWTVDVPPGTVLVGGLQESADVGIAEIAIVTLRKRNPSSKLDSTGFGGRIISAVDTKGQLLGAPLVPASTGCSVFPQGDLNEDCSFDILDAWWLNKYHMALLISQDMRSGYAPYTKSFDSNADGICTFADITFQLQVLFRQARFVEPVNAMPSPSSACATRLSVRLSPFDLLNSIGLPQPQIYFVLGGATDTLTGQHVSKPGLELLGSSSGIDISSLSAQQYRGVVVVAEAGHDDVYFADVVAGEGYDLQLGMAVIVSSPNITCQDADLQPEFFTLAKASDAQAYDFEYQGEFTITLPSQSSTAIASRVEGVGFNYLARLDVGRREGCDQNGDLKSTTTQAASEVFVPEPNNTSVSFDDGSGSDTNILLVAVVSTLIVVILALIIAVVAVVVRRSRRRMGLGTMKQPMIKSRAHTNNHYKHQQPHKMKHLDILPPDMMHLQEWGESAAMSKKPGSQRMQRNIRAETPITDLDLLMPPPMVMENYPLPPNYRASKTVLAPPSAIKSRPAPISPPMSAPTATMEPHQRVAPKYIPPRPYQELVVNKKEKKGDGGGPAPQGPMGFANAWGSRPDLMHTGARSTVAQTTPTMDGTHYEEPSFMEMTGQTLI